MAFFTRGQRVLCVFFAAIFVASILSAAPAFTGVTTLAGSPALQRPLGVAVDPSTGTVYVADSKNHQIKAIAHDGRITLLAGSGVPGLADGSGSAARFHEPTGIAFDAVSQVLYVADRHNHVLRRITLDGVVTSIAGTGKRGLRNGAAATAEFDQPAAMAIAADGSLLVADSANNLIRRIAGGQVTTFAGTGHAGSADGAAAWARFASPEGIAIRADGAVFIADSGNHRIRMIAGGNVSTVAGSVAGYADGSAATARFRDPHGLALDEDGALYVADTSNGAIRKIDAALGLVTTIAGAPERRNAPRPVDGPLATAALSDPFGITYAGALFVADARHDALRVIEPQLLLTSISPAAGPRAGGTTVTISGSGFVPGTISVAFGSSAATSVQFVSATEILATTPAGNGKVDVTVTLRGRSATLDDAFSYISPPTITSIAPVKGPASGGQLVTIEGTEFDTSTEVFFGGQAAASVIVESSTRLRATTPANAAGIVGVTVRTDAGEATLPASYTFAAAPVISSFAPLAARAGSTVTINGSNFEPLAADNEVRFAGAPAQVLSASATQLLVAVPAGASSGRITVTTIGGTATSSADFTVVSVVSITIAPPAASVEVGETTQLRAVGTRSDGSQVDVSADVTWSTSATQTVALLASGAVRGLAVGTAEVKAMLGSLEATAVVTVVAPTPLPPDPTVVAPPLDETISVPLHEATSFLYSGPTPIQSEVEANAIVAERAAVIRGRVLNRDGLALRGVRVSIRDHEELGWTLSRADGAFDLAVNGGGPLTLEYTKNGYLPAHRIVEARWQSYKDAPEVVLVPLDEVATRVVLNAPAAQVARGSAVTDDDGARQATLFIPGGTTGSMRMPDGSSLPLESVTIRATEYTVGDRGLASMPAPLPPSSGYTYCVELSADEALAAGAASVTFSAPLYFYVENFLDFPVGGIVPAGYYDRERAVWVPSANGKIIRVVSIDGGVAAIDTNGDGIADPASTLAALGLTAEEQSRLGAMYTAGKSLWRVPIRHFTPWDCNWPYGPPNDAAGPPSGTNPSANDPQSNDGVNCAGSIIECENQTLGERIGVEGSPFTLNYRSNRVEGRTVARQLAIPVSGPSVPASLKKIELTVSVEGKTWKTDVPAAPNQTVTFTWDGRDAYNRPVAGAAKATANITYTYPVVYQQPANFTESFARLSGIPLTAARDRAEIYLSRTMEARLESVQTNAAAGLGGWSLSDHHVYNARTRTLYKGDGHTRNGNAVATIIQRFAGQYQVYGETGNGGPALDAKMIFPWYVKAAPDGSVYVSDAATRTLRRVSPDGIISHVAGNKSSTDQEHDGDPAASAALNGPYNMAFGPDGSLYINDRRRVHRLSGGTITTVAGNGQCCTPSGDNGPARSATIVSSAIAVDANGVLYLADGNAIRKVENGIITSITHPTCGGPFLSGRASAACVTAYAIAIGPDGLLYGITGGAIWRINANGMMQVVAGCTSCNNTAADGSSAFSGRVSSRTTWGFDIGPDGTYYFSDDLAGTVRAVTPDGFITTIAGNGTRGFAGDGGPATAAQMFFPWGVSIGPDDVLYVSDSDWGVVRKLVKPFPSWSNAIHMVGSEDGEELYVFSSTGRHLRTIGRRRGEIRREFSYDGAGRILSVSDTDAGTTTIQRDAEGKPLAILAPGGQRAELALDDDGYLESVTNAADQSHSMTYGEGGLMESFLTPGGKFSTFVHNTGGALIADTGSDTGTQTLSRTATADVIDATLTSSLGRTWRVFTERRKDDSVRRTVTNAAGLTTQTVAAANGKLVRTAPDGTVITIIEGGDPRFGMNTPIIKDLTFKQPSGLTYRHTMTRTVTLADKNDPFSLLTETDTYAVNGRISTTTYDASAGTITMRSPLGRQIVLTLDDAERVTGMRMATFEPASLTYSGGQLSTMQSGDRSWSVTYDAERRLASASDPAGNSISLTYDPSGRMQTQTMSGSRQIGYSWTANGNLETLTTPDGNVHAFAYTEGDRLETYTPPQGRGSGNYQLAYNGDGQLRAITQPNNATLTFGYDSAGRIDTISGAQRQTKYEYLPGGAVGKITAPGGSLTFTYDGSQVTGITSDGAVPSSLGWTYNSDFAAASESVAGSAVTFGYDNDGLLVRSGDLVLTRDAGNGTVRTASIGKLAETYRYNNHGELEEYAVTYDGAPLTSYNYGRGAGGRITTITRPHSLTGFSYDAAGRLQSATSGVVTSSSYLYDKNGNRTKRTRPGIVEDGTYDEQDRLVSYGDTTYAFTPNGELETMTTGGATTSFGYDSFGNLRTVAIPGMAIEYLVDAVNRRVGKKVDGTLSRGWIYADGFRIVAEVDGSGAIVSRFVYGIRSNVPDYFVRDGATYRIIANHVGSPELVVNVATGEVMQRIEYDEFGAVVSDTNPGFQPFGFAGGLYDRDTGFVRFGTRDYDTRTGRWTTKDPIGFGGGDANLYAYVFNDPVNNIDPSGLSAQSVALCFLKGAAVGAAGALVVGGAAVLLTTLGAPVAAVTLGLGALAIGGAIMLGVDVGQNIQDRNWDGLAYNIGSVIGGAAAGGASGRSVAQGINGKPSGPFRFNDSHQNYKPHLGSVWDWLGTGPNVGSAAGSQAVAGAGAATAAAGNCGC